MAKKPIFTKPADTVFPYLTSILSGRMTQKFAGDRAEAAVNALWNKDAKIDEGDPSRNLNPVNPRSLKNR